MITERDYLYLAIEKAGCVVMVRHFDSAEKIRRSKIEYMSGNVGKLGMNMETVRKGYRLPEDYIHPDDREGFADAMARAFRLGNDFSYELRVIGDDGVLRRINMDVIFLKSEAQDFLVEYIFRELERYKSDNQDVNSSKEEDFSSIKLTREFIEQNMLEDYFNNYASSCDLYSAVLDMNGRLVIEPSGPKTYLGEFYNYMENLEHDQFFSKIKNNPDYHPQKLTAMCLCIGAMLNLDESRDLLARAGYALSPSDKTDIIFSYFIENKIYDMIELDIQLEEHGLECIIA